jgi:hypothetical protein
VDDTSFVALHQEVKSESEWALICRARRERCRPRACDGGERCWVRDGAAAYRREKCTGCHATIGGITWSKHPGVQLT